MLSMQRRSHHVLLHAHPFERHEVVCQLHQINFFAHTPRQSLLMQRQVADVIGVQLEGLCDHGLALGFVGF